MNNLVIQVPEQALPDSRKDLEWGMRCVDAGENVLMFDSSVVRQTFYNKKVNYRLRNNMLTDKDIQQICEPYGVEFSAAPKSMQHIGLGNSKINTLVGEEAKRLTRYPFKAYISSDDQMGISSKEENIRDMWHKKLVDIAVQKLEASVEGQQVDPRAMEEEMQKEIAKYERQLEKLTAQMLELEGVQGDLAFDHEKLSANMEELTKLSHRKSEIEETWLKAHSELEELEN